MRRTIRAILVALVALAVLAGCGEPQPLTDVPVSLSEGEAVHAHADRASSWMAAGTPQDDLIYVSDQRMREVRVFSWPKPKLVGRLSDFQYPEGLCVDKAGDVYVTDGRQIDEYAHGGTQRIATLSNGTYTPIACSVDPSTGNLATANYSNGVSIFQKARGEPKVYSTFINSSCNYDNRGNLFVEGQNSASFNGLEKLEKGQNFFHAVTVRGTYRYLLTGTVQGYGSDLALSSNYGIYRAQVSGYVARVVGTTSINGGSNGNFSIEQSILMGSDGANAFFYNYPAGGNPIARIGNDRDPFRAPKFYAAVMSVAH